MRRCPRSSERAFTLIEVLVAVGIWIVLGGALLYAAQGVLATARQATAQQQAYLQLTHLIEVWNAESSSALAIFVPGQDVLGANNGDGHELDFYSRDASRVGHFWAYRWDPGTATLQRYTYGAPGDQPALSDPPMGGIRAFHAYRRLASSLAPAFAGGYVPRDVAVNFGYPGVDGGNAIAAITIGDMRDTFMLELLPGTMTSGFSVVVSTFTPAPTATTAAPVAPPPPTATPGPTLVSASYVFDYLSTGCVNDNCDTVLYSVWSCIGIYSDGSQQDLFDAINNDESQPPNDPYPPTDPANTTPPGETCPPS